MEISKVLVANMPEKNETNKTATGQTPLQQPIFC